MSRLRAPSRCLRQGEGVRAGQFSGLAWGGEGQGEAQIERGGGGGVSSAAGGPKNLSQCARHREGHGGLVC